MGCDDDDWNSLPRYCAQNDPKDHHPVAPVFWRKVIPISGSHYRGVGATASKPRDDRATERRTPNVVSRTRCLQKRCPGLSDARGRPLSVCVQCPFCDAIQAPELKYPMKLFHHITVFYISEQEKTAFLDAGVAFIAVTRGTEGESAILEIGEDDPRWQRVAALLTSLEGNDHVPKNYRIQDLLMTKPTFRESATAPLKGSQIGNLGWLDGYS